MEQKRSRSGTKVQQKCNRSAAEVRQRCDRSATEVQQKCNGSGTKELTSVLGVQIAFAKRSRLGPSKCLGRGVLPWVWASSKLLAGGSWQGFKPSSKPRRGATPGISCPKTRSPGGRARGSGGF